MPEPAEPAEAHKSVLLAAKATRTSKLKELTALVVAVAGLLTAALAFFKPQDTRVAEKSYDELKKSVEDLTLATSQNHDDVIALRAYLLGYANGENGSGIAPPLPIPFSPSPFAAETSNLLPSPPLLRPTDAGATMATAPSAASVTTSSIKSPPPVPTVHSKPTVHPPPDFATLRPD